MTTWQEMFTRVLDKTGESLGQLEFSWARENEYGEPYPNGGQLIAPFDSGYGLAEGIPFIAWGPHYVYFPVVYDGSEWISYVPRNPCDDFVPQHVGGE